MKRLSTYRFFKRFSAIFVPVLMLVMLVSQFPLSSHCYKMMLGDHHSNSMVCMKDKVCHTTTDGQHSNCQCHKKHGDRPFYCSCGGSASAMLSGLQLSKVLLPELPTVPGRLVPRLIPPDYLNPTSAPSGKEIFHPPRIGSFKANSTD